MNVSAWARLARQDDRRFNWNLVRALAKVFGRSMPRKLPERKPVAADSKTANRDDDLFGVAGSEGSRARCGRIRELFSARGLLSATLPAGDARQLAALPRR